MNRRNIEERIRPNNHPTSVFSRYTHASIALRLGETVLAIGRLLGHADPETTLKYTHAADATVMQAAETVGAVLGAE